MKTGRFSYCKGEKQVASYCLQFRTTFSPRRFQPQYIATMRKTSRCCLGRESRAGPGGWHRHARGQGPGASYRPGPEAAALAAEADRSAVREGTLRWPSPAVRPAGGEARRGVGGGGGGRCRGRAATAFAFAFPSAGPFWFPAAFPRSHVVRLFPPRRSPSRRRPRACALRPAGVGGAQPGGGPRTHPRAGLWEGLVSAAPRALPERWGGRYGSWLRRRVGGAARRCSNSTSGAKAAGCARSVREPVASSERPPRGLACRPWLPSGDGPLSFARQRLSSWDSGTHLLTVFTPDRVAPLPVGTPGPHHLPPGQQPGLPSHPLHLLTNPTS